MSNSQPESPAFPIADYVALVTQTDRFDSNAYQPILLGLYGEIGGIMAAVKKHLREEGAFPGYKESVEEEFGDAFWYFSALVRRLELNLSELISRAVSECACENYVAASGKADGTVSTITRISTKQSIDELLLSLGEATSKLLRIRESTPYAEKRLLSFLQLYLSALQASGLSFADVLKRNINKVRDRFLEPDSALLPNFDLGFPEEERLPLKFEIMIRQRKSGKSQLSWNGVFIGDPLTDNIMDPDGYRFHDVLHLAHAAILHWSPTFRALIKHKRKSDPKFDANEDGGRAIVVEEGLTAWVFSRAKGLALFEGQDKLSYDLLKSVGQFVKGYEVEKCPLRLWEKAILEGYRVFREVGKHEGGIIICDRENRTINFRPLDQT